MNDQLTAPPNNKVRPCIVLAGVLLLSFVLIYIINRLYPLYSDDWSHSLAYPTLERIGSFSNIFVSQYNRYFTWGGRSVVHAIDQVLLWMGLDYAHIVNSIVFVFYLYLIYRISLYSQRINIALYVLIAILAWVFIPAFSNTVLWLTGSANYMWGTVIVILFLFPYYSYYINEKASKNYLQTFFIFIGGIFAGWTNENMFAAQFFFVVTLFILLRYDKKQVPIWFVSGFVGLCIGGFFMLAAPGNFVRAEMVNESLGQANESFVYIIGYRLLKICFRYSVYILPLSAIYLALLWYKIHGDKTKEWRNAKTIRMSLLFFITAHIACIAMVASPIFPARAAFGAISFIFIAFGILYAQVDIKGKIAKFIQYTIVTLLCIVALGLYYDRYVHIKELGDEYAEREKFVLKEKELGNRDIIFRNKVNLPSRFNFEDLSDNTNYWLNKKYTQYYGINSVRVVSSNEN